MSHNVVGVDMNVQRKYLRQLLTTTGGFSWSEAQELVHELQDCQVLAVRRLAVLAFDEGRKQGYNSGFDDALDTYNRY